MNITMSRETAQQTLCALRDREFMLEAELDDGLTLESTVGIAQRQLTEVRAAIAIFKGALEAQK